ncbi:hypothetical protein VCHA37P191_220100 [Vibrio chagasii]|nr:hypothetical protein VCHA37P191_220100 [Vibrio chagasii]CAH7160425.1 hypothetical protein VCHA37P193_20266 [Vibrio chagasii]CAH7248785.1 hypothetical protein VCHA57P511_180012 [Vibrio chagasii]
MAFFGSLGTPQLPSKSLLVVLTAFKVIEREVGILFVMST